MSEDKTNKKNVVEDKTQRIDTINTIERGYILADGTKAKVNVTSENICIGWTDNCGNKKWISVNPTESGIGREVLVTDELSPIGGIGVLFDDVFKKPVNKNELRELYFIRDTVERIKKILTD